MKVSIIFLIILFLYLGWTMANDMEKLLPKSINSWTSSGQDAFYTPTNIFQYLDGGAELYITYNMKELFSRRYKNPNQSDIVVDIFKMQSYKDAYALFTHNYNGNELNIGRGSKYETGLLIFWKDIYYVSILAEEENEDSKRAVLRLGKIISKNIKNNPAPVDLSIYFPAHKDKPKFIHYINNHNVLNLFYFFSKDNIFNISYETDAAISQYSINNQILYLLVVRYQKNKNLLNTYENILSMSNKKQTNSQIIFISEKPYIGIKKVDNFLIGVFNGRTKEDIEKLMKEVVISFPSGKRKSLISMR